MHYPTDMVNSKPAQQASPQRTIWERPFYLSLLWAIVLGGGLICGGCEEREEKKSYGGLSGRKGKKK